MYDFSHFDHITFPVFVLEVGVDNIPRYAACNASACRLTGKSLSDYLGRTAQEVFPGTQGGIDYRHQCNAITSGHECSYQLELPDNGTSRVLQTTLKPVKDAKGLVRWLYGSAQDITAQHNAALAKQSFEQLSGEMTQFVAIAAHDLRTPLRNVAFLADTLRDAFAGRDDDKIGIIDILEDVAETSLLLITDVLRSAQDIPLPETSSRVNLQDLCTDLSAVLDYASKHKINAPHVIMQTDSGLLQIALRNIIENAIKHAGRDRVVIDVSAQDATPGMIKITIHDNGHGFSPNALAFLDGGNFQSDSGYGLFGVKRLINARGGLLRTCNSVDGAGAMVEMLIPGKMLDGGLTNCPAHVFLPPPPTASLPHQSRI